MTIFRLKETALATMGFLFLPWMFIYAQEEAPTVRLRPDTTHVHASNTRWIVPALCVTYGVVARFNGTPVRRFDKYVAETVDKRIQQKYPIDNYTEFVPAVFAYGLDFFPGVASEHNLRDRTLLFATSYVITGAVVRTMKSRITVLRPNGVFDNSFPSGHTAVAFTGAHLLYKEYKNQSPWIGVGGYAVATATGVFRVVNQRHWVSDVVTGAGIGILSVEAAYLMLPVWHRLLGISGEDEQLSVAPAVTTRSVGVGLVYVF